MQEQKRIAAIHDISGMGKCSLTVALPVISASGVECACLPTALLSTHTGEFTGFTFKDLSDEMIKIARHWKQTGATFDGIYSGYLASAAQAELLLEIIDLLATENTRVIVDPVMADNGEYYSKHGEEMCLAFHKLCKRADIITPNITEAALLTDMPYIAGPHDESYVSELLEKLGDLCSGVIAVTGVCPNRDEVGAAVLDTKTGKTSCAMREHASGVFYGTGDIFASAFSALLVRGASLCDATECAIGLVGESIARTVERGSARRFGVDFEGALPGYILAASKLFDGGI